MDKQFVYCDCSCADTCPQGKRGAETRCRILKNKEQRMTRDEARSIISKFQSLFGSNGNGKYIDEHLKLYESLGFLKFDDDKHIPIVKGKATDVGEYKLELWPEGLVLWVDGKIVWKSWEKYSKAGDMVKIMDGNGYRDGNVIVGKLLTGRVE